MHKVVLLWSVIIAIGLSPAMALPTLVAQADADASKAPSAAAKAPEQAGSVDKAQVEIGVAGAGLNVNGNERRFEQYVTPPEGFYLNLLRIQSMSVSGKSLFDLAAQNIGESSAQGSFWLSAGYGAAVVQGQARNSRFFRDWSAGSSPFNRQDGAYELTVPTGAGRLRMSYDSVDLEDQSPSPLEDWSRSVRGIDYATHFNHGMIAGLGFDQGVFSFREGPQFSGHTDAIRFNFALPRTEHTSLQLDAALLNTSFDTLSTPQHANQIVLRGVRDLGTDLVLSGELSRDEITDTIIENTYIRRDTGGDLVLEYFGLPRTNIELGGGAHRLDYMLRNQAATVPVDETSLYARATTRLWKNVRLRLQHAQNWTDNAPATLDILGVPDGSLVWSQRKDSRAELTFTPMPRTGITGRLRRLTWKNGDMDTDNLMNEASLYGWWMPTNKMTLYMNYLRQAFNLHAVEATPVLYTTDNETLVYGASYQVSPKFLVDVAATDTDSRGATGVDERHWWLGLGYQLTPRTRLSVRASLGDFDTSDEAPLLNYDDRWFEVSLSNLIF